LDAIEEPVAVSSGSSSEGRSRAPVDVEVGMMQERLTLKVEEAAEALGISRALAYELVARGEIPSLRLGRRIVVPRRGLEAMLAEAAGESA
jgi:excisionase family DNA binding protein